MKETSMHPITAKVEAERNCTRATALGETNRYLCQLFAESAKKCCIKHVSCVYAWQYSMDTLYKKVKQ